MNLKEFFALKTMTQTALGAAIGVEQTRISQWTNRVRQVPTDHCPEIERATGGMVRCETLRPDVAWHVLRKSPRYTRKQAAA